MTDLRAQRGAELAKTQAKRFRTRGQGNWLVPSASHGGSYLVDLQQGSCTCPDHEERQVRCKHQIAVEIHLERVTAPDGSVTESVRVKYTQNWTAYNAAQTTEKEAVAGLLRDLVSSLPNPPHKKGRPRLPISDVVVAAAMKVYLSHSGRRASTDLRDLVEKGVLSHAPHYNSLSTYLKKPEMTPLLTELVGQAGVPLIALESQFAADSSGFATSTYHRWYDEKWGRQQSKALWVKCHVMVGARTCVIAGVRVTGTEGPGTGDATNLLPMAEDAVARGFSVAEVSADKAYLSRANLAGIAALGATPYIPFKANSVPGPDASELWSRLWYYFMFNREEFLQHYHQRSNSETVFAMLKSKLGASVRSKDPVAQTNEVLLKCLLHNLCRVNHAIHEFGIEPTVLRQGA